MKSTVEIPDPLFDEVRRYASAHGLTLKAVIELGLRRVLEAELSTPEFRLRQASIKGRGLAPELRDAGWQRIRDAAYEGRGG